uniref:Uncharacterized protein n=1 Tax=Oryza sativa subsp. japonica TaxID=39947 RepID=Q8S5G2_ORYSJ|nr:Hypothetical protein [Oryza sativa Japonica Group]
MEKEEEETYRANSTCEVEGGRPEVVPAAISGGCKRIEGRRSAAVTPRGEVRTRGGRRGRRCPGGCEREEIVKRWREWGTGGRARGGGKKRRARSSGGNAARGSERRGAAETAATRGSEVAAGLGEWRGRVGMAEGGGRRKQRQPWLSSISSSPAANAGSNGDEVKR